MLSMNVPSPLLNKIVTVLSTEFRTAKSVFPSSLKSPVAIATGAVPAAFEGKFAKAAPAVWATVNSTAFEKKATGGSGDGGGDGSGGKGFTIVRMKVPCSACGKVAVHVVDEEQLVVSGTDAPAAPLYTEFKTDPGGVPGGIGGIGAGTKPVPMMVKQRAAAPFWVQFVSPGVALAGLTD